MMKNISLLVAIVMGFLISGCAKKDTSCNVTVVAPGLEVEALEQYLTANKIEAAKDSRGFYYRIEVAGTGDHPNACSNVVVNYTGTLTNGTIFDQKEGLRFDLGNLIKGWQAGIPLIAKGGKITLYIPPSLGYGAQSLNGIPGNSILIFSIDLVKIN